MELLVQDEALSLSGVPARCDGEEQDVEQTAYLMAMKHRKERKGLGSCIPLVAVSCA